MCFKLIYFKLRYGLALSLLCFASLYSASNDSLTSADVGKIMQQIFDQHVDQKEMSSTILKHAFRVYIDQFDPYRIYLLDEEVRPYLDISDSQMNQILEQYRYNDFSAFANLNNVIQKAIERARLLRRDIEKDKTALFHPSASALKDQQDWLDPNLDLPFASSVDELSHRIKSQFVHFIAEEKKRFGKEPVLKHQDQTLGIYDRYLRNRENSYLYQTDEGKPLAAQQEESLFVMHVLKSLANSLDAHTTFYNNIEAYDMKARLEKEFEGIGVVLQQDTDGSIVITKLIAGGPAAKSGLIQPKDHLVAIDGASVAEHSLDKIMEMIRGANGTSVTLQLKRAAKDLNVTLKREPIAINEDRVDTSFDKFGDGIIGKITLHAFYQGENGVSAENDVRNAIKELSKKGHLRGLILDLRDNTGGFLSQAIKVAGIFITNGVVVISKYSNGHERYYRDMEGKIAYDGPLVILTSKMTASAAEIVAEALQDYGVAVIAGDEHTYGKGTIQSQTVTDNHATSFFKVTVGKYYTVSGKTPQIQGVKADILVPGPYSEERIGEKYLEYSLPPDNIKPEFNDDLADVDPTLKAWYMRYYIPTIQSKKLDWTTLLPILQRNSEYRIAHNKNYQAFLNELKGIEDSAQKDSELAKGDKQKGNFGADDLQMAEAVNIVKDMIMLHPEAQAEALAKKEPSPNP
jgi:carboxyl-terminal processing protease